ncbi:hypothetical protein LXA43DRAFT_886164 [Ganoderma leucocontextum]|nr:hypothetical protein LXA43DRAFT_886164 [Ganoderma leucocontextum]
MSPILSCRSRRETPLSSGNTRTAKLPQSNGEMLQTWRIHPAEDVAFDEVHVNVDDALGNKLEIDAESHQAVLNLIKTVPTMSARTGTAPTTRNFDEFLRTDTPPLETIEPEILPIFPRTQQPGRTAASPRLGKTGFLTSLEATTEFPGSWLSPVEVKDEAEEDIANEHLVIVGGWDGIKTPSSPLTLGTPSLVDTSSDIDELFLPSSSAGGLGEEFLPMEEFQLPKTERFGGRCSKPSRLGEGQSDDSITFAAKIVERACGGFLGDDDPYSLILGEKIDEKDEHLMNVPTLRPPNEHGAGDCLPTRLSNFVIPPTTTVPPGSGLPAHFGGYTGFLKKAKGLQSLQLELSWIPFKYGRTVPTDEEVADVADDPSAQLVKTIDLPQEDITSRLSELLNDISVFSSQPSSTAMTPSALVWSLDDESDLPILESFDDDIGLVLTRKDRMRVSGLSPLVDRVDDSNDDEDANDPISPPERPTKRVRFQDVDDLEDAARTVFEEIIDEAAYTVDDSGVFFASSESHVDNGTYASTFIQMAYDAEGFDGPATDGNLFLDMDPIHYHSYNSDLSSDDLSNFPAQSAFPVMSHPDNHAFVPTSLEQLQITHIEAAAADEPSPRHPPHGFRTSSPAPLGSAPPASTNIVPATISHISLDPYSASDAMVNEDGLSRPSLPPGATAAPALSARQSLAQYLALCGKVSSLQPDASNPTFPMTHETGASELTLHEARATSSCGHRDAPTELFDGRTLLLPEHYTRPGTGHTYMASLSLVQKRALVRALAACCAVDIVERECPGDSSANPDSEDLILDCNTAVLFASLELLPARAAGLLALLTRLSWRYAHLLVVFECYPSAWDYSGDATRTTADERVASVWSPPVVKAVRNLKRDLAIAEGLQTKCEASVVEYAFANSPAEAAAFARTYGDSAEARDATSGDVWGQRLWLTHEERDGEYDLCGVDGMNLFASCLLLSQVSLEDFLETTPEERLLEYGTLVGVDRIVRFNAEMARRLDVMRLPPSSPIDTSSSLHSVPVLDDSDMDGLH